MVICGSGGAGVAGIFTERDVVKLVVSGRDPVATTVGDCMTKNPICVPESCDDATAMRLMAQGRFRHLPVVAASSGTLVGLHDCLQLGKSLLHGGSKGMLARAKTYLRTFFATTKAAGGGSTPDGAPTMAATVASLCGNDRDTSALAVDSGVTVLQAVRAMADQASSALLVAEAGIVCGIFTERDL